MRVLMLAQTYAPVIGGEERLVEDLGAALVRRGHEVAVATLKQPGGEPPREGPVRVHALDSSVHRIPGIATHPTQNYAPPLPDPRTTAGLRRVLREERPDVVHAHNWLVGSYLPLARRAAPPLVLSLHDYGLLCPTKRLFLHGGICSGPAPAKCLSHACEHYGRAIGAMVAAGTRLAEPWARHRVDMFVAVSAAVARLCRVPAGQRSRVIPNFVGDLPPFPAAEEDHLGFLPKRPFVLYFGDVAEDKGVGVLLDAYAGLDDPPPLVLLGRRRIEGLEGRAGVVAPGPVPHRLAIEAARRAALVAVPSVWAEPFGIVAIEAAAAGRPVLASAIGGLEDIVVDGETGMLVPPGDPGALRAALKRMLADADMRSEMGAAARRRVRLEFSPEVVVPRFEDAYRAAIAARRSVAPP